MVQVWEGRRLTIGGRECMVALLVSFILLILPFSWFLTIRSVLPSSSLARLVQPPDMKPFVAGNIIGQSMFSLLAMTMNGREKL